MKYNDQAYTLASYLLIALCSLFLAGCASKKVNTKSSVMDYLYPTAENRAVQPSIPKLKLPLRVGIAFVPENRGSSRIHGFWSGTTDVSALTPIAKRQLLEQVASNFKHLEYVEHIEIIPSTYLTPQGSFANLSQIKTMYGIDVIALVSYDQVQFTDEGMLSLSYWTIVGAYLVSGEKNDTSTLIDTVVYDIDSQKLLFRAPGTSQVRGRSTPVNLSEELRKDSYKGFEKATSVMIKNLDLELERFSESLKNDPSQAEISYKKNYRGGGSSINFWGLTCLGGLLLLRRLKVN